MCYLLVSSYAVLEAKRSICDILHCSLIKSGGKESVTSQKGHRERQGNSCIVPVALVRDRHIYTVEHFLLTRHKESEYSMIL